MTLSRSAMDETKDDMVSEEATETDPDSDARNKATRNTTICPSIYRWFLVVT